MTVTLMITITEQHVHFILKVTECVVAVVFEKVTSANVAGCSDKLQAT